MSGATGLTSIHGEPIALKSVHIDGRVDGLLADMTIFQRYHNDSGKNLEIVYTFPLAWGTTLLGMKVTIGDRTLEGVILERWDARERYEDALDGGDTPGLMEQAAQGLFTVNLGNIADGEDVLVELSYAQLLRFENDLVPLRIPLVIASRYGDQHQHGGLALHENAAADILAEYPFSLKIALKGPAAHARVACHSHACDILDTENGKEVLLRSGAALDRDVCLTLSGMQGSSFALFTPENGGYASLACFHPAFPKSDHLPLGVKILLDCSSSMAGDCMALAQGLLFTLLGALQSGDLVSFSRFGRTLRHETGGLLPWSPGLLERLGEAIADSRADLGGTEMERALIGVLEGILLSEGRAEGRATPPDVLLITNGAVWDQTDIARAAMASGQRIFAVGVGSAPAEGVLRELARNTGGECVFVAPGGDGSAALLTMLDRMRQPRAESLRVDWGAEPAWQSPLPENVYPGDTVQVFASFTGVPPQPPALCGVMGGRERTFRAGTMERAEDGSLLRLAGAARLKNAPSPEEARALALHYQLLSEHTALFLTHTREGQKNTVFPVLQQVPQMIAAGHGGFGSVVRSKKPDGLGAGPARREVRMPDKCAITAKNKATGDGPRIDPSNPLFLLHVLVEAARGDDEKQVFHSVARIAGRYALAGSVARFRDNNGLTEEQAWALLLFWLKDKAGYSVEVPIQALQFVYKHLQGISHETLESFFSKMDERYPDVGLPMALCDRGFL